MDEGWILIIICVALFACVIGGSVFFERQACFSKTSGMGFDVQWSMLGGCRIEVESGKWIPLDSYYFKQE